MVITQKILPSITSADVLVGIPCFNESDNISFVASVVDKAFSKFFPGKNCVVCAVDNSPDFLTKNAFLSTNTSCGKLYVRTSDLGFGKGANIRALLELQDFLNCPVAAMVDADLLSITPDWINLLTKPVFDGFDLVTPLYSRHHLDGTITNNIVYPLIYGLLGKDVRQPIGGDFGFSLSLCRFWLGLSWKESTYHYGVDNFMSVHALTAGFSVCQVGLGAKVHKPSAPKLNEMFSQVVDTLFFVLSSDISKFSSVSLSEVEVSGLPLGHPQDLVVDVSVIKEDLLFHWNKNNFFIKKFLPDRFIDLKEGFDSGFPLINDSFWCELVYSLLAKYVISSSDEEKSEVVESLKPLYFARILTYIKESENLSEEQAEALVRHQAKVFFNKRDSFFKLISSVYKTKI